VRIVIGIVFSVGLSCRQQGFFGAGVEVIRPGIEHQELTSHVALELFDVFSAFLDCLAGRSERIDIGALLLVDKVKHVCKFGVYCSGGIFKSLLSFFCFSFQGLLAAVILP